jgi:Tol biopolymer transport system component
MINTGTRLGVYELTSPLGAGGMGEVYRARDTRLGRDVAVKVLAAEFAKEPARRARFEQEARSVAALNHPNILALYDIGNQGDVAFMVTELVDGESLRDMRLPPRKALEIAAQIADGLAAAHAAGVTHRDLKPDNVMITRDGRAKILDFGIAKLAGASDDPSTKVRTQTGMLVGTVGYMAPEQVRGADVDPRTDIFAFGAVLYELLAGRRAFDGETPAEIMTAILRQEPPELPDHVPAAVRQIVHRCLEKKPEERFQSARDLAFALRHLTGSSVAAVEMPPPHTRRFRTRAWIAAAGFAAGVVFAGALARRWSAAQDASVDPVQLTRISADRLDELAPAFSPDGRSVAYLRVRGGLTELLVRPLDALTPITLVGSRLPLRFPMWSSDGNRICYTLAGGDLMCVGAAGGTPQRIVQDAYSPRFTPDGNAILFVRVHDGKPWLYRSAPPGGEPHAMGDAPLPSDVSALSPVSPDGSKLIAFGESGRWLFRLGSGARRALPIEGGLRTASLSWLPDSRHIAAAEETTNPIGSRLAIEDTDSPARRLIVRSADPIAAVTLSPDGKRLVYSGGPVDRDVVEYSADGRFVRGVATSSLLEGFPSWAPAEDRFVYRVGGPGQSDSLWIGRSDGTAAPLVQRLPSNTVSRARFSPDGGRIAYVDPSGIQVVSTSGGRAIRVLSSADLHRFVCWSPDGEWIWYSEGARLAKLPSQGGDAVVVQASPAILEDCSPDGRWLLRRGPGQDGFILTSTDGRDKRQAARYGDYASPADNAAQFGESGKVFYLLNRDRRSLDVLEVDTLHKRRTISFEIPPEDLIQDFSVNSAGTRVLLTTGGDRNDLWMAEGFAQPASSWSGWFRHWEPPPKRSPPP